MFLSATLITFAIYSTYVINNQNSLCLVLISCIVMILRGLCVMTLWNGVSKGVCNGVLMVALVDPILITLQIL